MWAAQWYKYRRPRQWPMSSCLGAVGFELPAAIGAAVARPEALVIDFNSDGSFMMNVQGLATVQVENLPVKMMILNDQYLGMAAQWGDLFYKANRAYTNLGNPVKRSEIFPTMMRFAEACDIHAVRVEKKSDIRTAIQKMLYTPWT